MAYPGSQTKITIIHDRETTDNLVNALLVSQSAKRVSGVKIIEMVEAIIAGVRNGSIDVTVDDGNGVQASGTVTFSNFNTANDTFLINGVTFTAIAAATVNNQWSIGASAVLQAANLASAINSSTSALVQGYVTAVASTSIVTIKSAVAHLYGNANTIAKGTDAGTVMTVSGARLTGGLAPTNPTVGSTEKRGV